MKTTGLTDAQIGFLPSPPLRILFNERSHQCLEARDQLIHTRARRSRAPLRVHACAHPSLEGVGVEDVQAKKGNDDIVEDAPVAFVLSHFEAQDLLQLKAQAPTKDANTNDGVLVHGDFSIDIGQRAVDAFQVLRDGIGAATPHNGEEKEIGGRGGDGRVLATWDELAKMGKKGRFGAFEVFSDGASVPRRIAMQSTQTGATLSLMPVARGCVPPTLVLSGFTMHRVKNVTPAGDTRRKIDAIRHGLRGCVLDICTGLGYTAVALATCAQVAGVTTVERDAGVLEIAARNPWSRACFHHPKIEVRLGDATDVIRRLANTSYDAIVHDPPARVIGGDLYSRAFYAELFRVCRRGGVVFHYIGDPASRESGRLFDGVMQRLRSVGFVNVCVVRSAFGVYGERAR